MRDIRGPESKKVTQDPGMPDVCDQHRNSAEMCFEGDPQQDHLGSVAFLDPILYLTEQTSSAVRNRSGRH